MDLIKQGYYNIDENETFVCKNTDLLQNKKGKRKKDLTSVVYWESL